MSNEQQTSVGGSAVTRCSTAIRFPERIADLSRRCEANVTNFTNEEMSIALTFGQMLFSRLGRLASYYEQDAAKGGRRAKLMALAAEDMRAVMSDCVQDCQ